MQYNQEEVFSHLQKVLIELFELEESAITADAKLYDDLDIDSIDTVDLLIELKKFTGTDMSPHQFTDVQTIDDIVQIVAQR